MPTFLVERLTVGTWLRAVAPRLAGESAGTIDGGTIYFIDGQPLAVALARRMLARRGLRLEQLDFDCGYVYDEKGRLVWLRIYYEDMARALERVTRDPVFHAAERSLTADAANLGIYLRKQCLPGPFIVSRRGLWRALLVIQVGLWKARTAAPGTPRLVLFLERRPWWNVLNDYARDYGNVVLLPVCRGFRSAEAIVRLLARDGRLLLQRLQRALRGELPALSAPGSRAPLPPCIGVQCYGQFNLERPELHSDFFFWQQSKLPGRNVLALFGLPSDPLNGERASAMARQGIRALALRFDASRMPARTVFARTRLARNFARAAAIAGRAWQSDEQRWLGAERAIFASQTEYWRSLFEAHNLKVFTSWFKYTADHCAIAEAMREADGVLAIYQRSFEGNATVQATVTTDIMFAFSRDAARVEAHAGSRIAYCVTTGYLGDHRFPRLMPEAERIRAALRASGASYIAAYFDENSGEDARWIPGHRRQQAPYAFLLEKVVSEPKFGLVLKPKTPRSLRQRLGTVAELLDRALATGRCHIHEDGVLQGVSPPAQAALAADVAIHCSIASATAGVEAALAGVPTLLMDEDGWTMSPLYRLGPGRVIFTEWDALWHTWRDHRSVQGGVPGFGDWSPVLDELDPFRDGRAAERMGTYLKWLIEGYEGGLPREAILAGAAERYCRAWGNDKVTAVQPLKSGRLA